MIKLAMGATHIKHEKLVNVVQTIQKQQMYLDPNYYQNLRIDDWSILDQRRDKMISLYNHDDVRLSLVKYVPEMKYDGYAYLFTKDDISENMGFYSRNLSTAVGTAGQPICKSDWIPHITDDMKKIYQYYGVDVQGEIYVPGGTSDDVTKIMGCTVDKALSRQTNASNKAHYRWIDIRKYLGMDITHEPYWVRRALMEHIYGKLPESMKVYIKLVDIMPDAVDSFRKIILNGGEGMVIKDTSKPYVDGKKPVGSWIKCKREVTLDTVIIGFNKGTGKNAGLFGSIKIGLYDENGKFKAVGNVSSGIDDDLRRKMASDPESYKGKVIEVSAMQPNIGKASFRHLAFKSLRLDEDKSKESCTMDGIVPKLEII